MTTFVNQLITLTTQSVRFTINDYFSPLFKFYGYLVKVIEIPNELKESRALVNEQYITLIEQQKRLEEVYSILNHVKKDISEIKDLAYSEIPSIITKLKGSLSEDYKTTFHKMITEHFEKTEIKREIEEKLLTSFVKSAYPHDEELEALSIRGIEGDYMQTVKLRDLTGLVQTGSAFKEHTGRSTRGVRIAREGRAARSGRIPARETVKSKVKK